MDPSPPTDDDATPPPALRWTWSALAGVIVLLAASLAALGALAYRSADGNARLALQARLSDRSRAVHVRLTQAGLPSDRADLQARLETAAADATPGYAHIVRHDGVVLASTEARLVGERWALPDLPTEGGPTSWRAEPSASEAPLQASPPAQRDPHSPGPPFAGGPPPHGGPPGGPGPRGFGGPPRGRLGPGHLPGGTAHDMVRTLDGAATPSMERWSPTLPGHIGDRQALAKLWRELELERGPGATPGPPAYLCIGMPLRDGLIGVDTARAQMVASLLGALALLGLALAMLRTARRAERMRLEIERRQRLAALGQLAAVLAHEIRTPVASVRGNAQVLLERLGDDPGGRKARLAHRIVRDTDRMSRLVEDLLGYARPEALQPTRVDVSEVVMESAERLVHVALERDVQLMSEPDLDAELEADPHRLGQAFDNLLRNAIEASPSGETVVIRVEAKPRAVVVEVIDRGPGVPHDQREAIFAPFHTSRAAGTGLGLAVCRRVADEHGAQLTVHDRPQGGAVFRMTLLRDAQPQASHVSAPAV